MLPGDSGRLGHVGAVQVLELGRNGEGTEVLYIMPHEISGRGRQREGEVRVVSWNIAFRGPKAAKRQGGLLRELDEGIRELRARVDAALKD